jgi:hypothetical protein
MAEPTNAIQKLFLENSLLGILMSFPESANTATRRWAEPASSSPLAGGMIYWYI